ncbi:MAG TPA: TCR/Tet family MFS transporter [Steroidobacteraceae bacterium]|jgi:DHA1 family tetracycline resistance protein-like MFS transporter|nr:TCR/Tet family MFS transporter [Steroidobacteraceae bacterium]
MIPVASSPRRRAALVFIFVTVVLDMLALGMILPVLPHLIEDFLGGDTARAAKIFGLFGSVWAVMQFVSMPVMGGLSDRFGRRPVILLSNLGLGLDYVLMALAPNLRWLFVGRVISGVTAASISTAMAYIADVTPPENRAKSYGLVGMAFGLGFIVGPALGGVLGSIDPRLPFWAAAAASLANAAYGYFVLPESLPPERRRAFEWKRANPAGSLKFLRAHREITGLAAAAFLSAVAHAVLPAVFVLYAGYRYGWDEKTVGLALAVVGASSVVVQGTLVGPLVRRFGERRVLLAGLLAGAIGFIVYALAPTGAWFLAGIPVVALWGLAAPSAQGLMTRHVGANVQGELQGAMGSLQGIATVIGPVMFATIFAWSIEAGRQWHFPGAAYTLAALLLVASATIVARAARDRSVA